MPLRKIETSNIIAQVAHIIARVNVYLWMNCVNYYDQRHYVCLYASHIQCSTQFHVDFLHSTIRMQIINTHRNLQHIKLVLSPPLKSLCEKKKTRWSLIHDDFPFEKKNIHFGTSIGQIRIFHCSDLELCAATVITANIVYYSILFQRQWKPMVYSEA